MKIKKERVETPKTRVIGHLVRLDSSAPSRQTTFDKELAQLETQVSQVNLQEELGEFRTFQPHLQKGKKYFFTYQTSRVHTDSPVKLNQSEILKLPAILLLHWFCMGKQDASLDAVFYECEQDRTFRVYSVCLTFHF